MQYRLFKEYNIVYCSEAVLTPVGRFSWPSLTAKKEPRPGKDGKVQGEPKFEVSILLDKKEKAVKAFLSELEGYAEEMVEVYNTGDKPELGGVKKILRDGDQSDHEKYPQEKGCWIIQANNKNLPELYDAAGESIDPSVIKAGMKGKMFVTPRLSSGGIGFQVECCQVTEDDGVRFGGAKADYRKSLLGEVNGEDETPDTDSGAEETEEQPKKTLSAKEVAKQQAEALAAKRKTSAGKGKSAAVNLL